MSKADKDQYRERFTAELARIICCKPDEMPMATSKENAAKYLGLKNPNTLNVWNVSKRHSIVMLKTGRVTEPTTDWLINFKLSSLEEALNAA